jgi:hypothetical protein
MNRLERQPCGLKSDSWPLLNFRVSLPMLAATQSAEHGAHLYV